MASASRRSRSFLLSLSSCDDEVGRGEGVEDGAGALVVQGMALDKAGSMLLLRTSWAVLVGLRSSDMPCPRWGTGCVGPDVRTGSSWSNVALKLRFRGEGTPICMSDGVGGPSPPGDFSLMMTLRLL